MQGLEARPNAPLDLGACPRRLGRGPVVQFTDAAVGRAPVAPSVRYVGGGDYRIDNLIFPKAGWWNVALVIDGKRGTDSLAFNVVVPPAR